MRDFKITKKSGGWYNAKVTDGFGVDHQNYYETEQECIDWIYYIWENEKPPLTHEQEMDMLAAAIWGCTKLDIKNGKKPSLD